MLLAQILFMLYWGHAKSGFYVDEFFTYDNAHYMSASTPKRVKMYDADYMEYNKWFELSQIKSTLTVNKGNSLLNDGLAYNVKAFMSKPYMALLNYVETVFFDDTFSKWSGISMNIVFFAIGQMFLYLLVKKTTNSEMASLLAMALFGVSGMAISMVAFVRFYMIANMWMIIFLYLHSLMWTENNLKKNILYEVLAMLVLYPAFKNSPLAMIEGAAVIVIFSAALVIRKRKRQFLFYALPIFAGGILYVVFFTGYLQIIFDTNKVAGGSMGVATASLVNNLLTLTPSNFVSRSLTLVGFVNDYLFSHVFILLVFGILAFLSIMRRIITKDRIDENRCFVYFVLTGTSMVLFIASVCLKLGEIRYNSFLYPLITVVIVTIAYDIAKTGKQRILTALVLSLAIGVQIYFTVTIPRIQNLYPEDKVGVESICKNKGIDNLVVDYKADDRVMYECVVYGDDASNVMFVRYEGCRLNDMPDTMLVWQSVNWSADIIDKLKEAGYADIEQIAQTHESMVFLCRR